MKAAVVTAFGAPLWIQERDIPEPAAGQVLVRMETCGLGHTNIHAANGDWPMNPNVFEFAHAAVPLVAHNVRP